ncbi:hypothetical protein CAOG_09129 [Capsaspora owczarzaki ATCC 30864]|uniref:Uncharacterized protein n=1 Tax=Capsaspora owczarzaki (strain ATCC 30864) TaxID=595528 RepID=A0A0D2URX7_CAPO3|nr:hypothetical protein CAOG_09129 [Capsaspora owczarzaki ATCC 30864]KJE97721.1 hypothetical protein CAOG_009129 [Capsaspora owczarzaki ATCC 30864]|eukprot:XP_011270839.1 hypothetical protein CAOG_09129 [Capsaspora owczarzaki ATCC 30864]
MRGSLRFVVLLAAPVLLIAWLLSTLASLYALPTTSGSGTAMGASPDAHLRRVLTSSDELTRPGPDDVFDNVFWFIHVSDLHISRYANPTRTSDFERFCREVVPVIAPPVVVVTGDLTDAKDQYLIDSGQHQEEWQDYAAALDRSGVLDKVKWLDIRGNHDAFDVAGLDHPSNLFARYSVSKNTSYTHVHQTTFGRYRFVAVDACPTPGPRRPFNFFGSLDVRAMTKLERDLAQPEQYNHTIAFAHYPLSTISSRTTASGATLRSLTSQVTLFLNGHLHTLLDYAPHLHMRHRNELAELEVGDWKDNRRFRVVVFDHDMFSFADVQLDQWPVVVVSNPKDARFLLGAHEPLGRIERSTHIRVLAFSPAVIASVRVFIDGIAQPEAIPTGGPLWVVPWKPRSFFGVHQMKVIVQDAAGRTQTIHQSFSTDGTLAEIGWMARYVMLTDFSLVLRVGFYGIFALFLALLVIPKMLVRHYKQNQHYDAFILTITHQIRRAVDLAHPRPSQAASRGLTRVPIMFWLNMKHSIPLLFRIFLLRLVILAQIPAVWYALVAHAVSLIALPLFVGELVRGHWGFFFVYGMVINGRTVTELGTYFFTFQHLLTTLPFVTYLASRVPIDALLEHLHIHRYDHRDDDDDASDSDEHAGNNSALALADHHAHKHGKTCSQPGHTHEHTRPQSPCTALPKLDADGSSANWLESHPLRLSPSSTLALWGSRVIYGVLALFAFTSVRTIYMCYGGWAVVLAPAKTWFYLYGIFLVLSIDRLILRAVPDWQPRAGARLVSRF